MLLYSVPWPPQGLYFKKEVNSVEDMQGVKFRSYNPATATLAELTGMVPVQIEAAEISQAFATGVAESMISSGATGYEMKVWEQLNHFYPVNAWMPRNTVFINKDVWNDLDDSKKNVIRGCASLAAYAGRAKAQWYTDYTVKGLAANGMTVEEPSDKLKSQLQEIGQKMADQWQQQAGEEGKKILDAYKASKG